jgi:4-amino-4-deoxy-L-arabinose transferase-like glycosyltransferase
LIYFGTALVVHAIARRLYGAKTGFFAAIGFALAPGVALSSGIMSTDVLLLFFWALGLYAFLRLREGGGWRDAALLGIAIGFGLLAKYAMVYFIGCALIAALIDRPSRAVVLSRRFGLAIAVAVLMIAPNIAWNFGNGFVTFLHTGENIEGSGFRFQPLGALGFIASQFGIIGPALYAGLLIAAWLALKGRDLPGDRVVIAFALPVSLVVAGAGFFTKTNANWGAAAFIGAAIIGTAVLLRLKQERWIQFGLWLGIVAQVAVSVGGVYAPVLNVPHLSRSGDLYKAMVGWHVFASEVRDAAKAAGAGNIIVTERAETAELLYYLRGEGFNITVWPDDPTPDHHFELTISTVDHPPVGPALLVTGCADPARLAPYFADVAKAGALHVPSGQNSARNYVLYRLDGRNAPLQAVPLCEDHD